MSFEAALKEGRLEEARSTLDDLARSPETGDLWLPECYADVAMAFDRRRQHDDAIAAMERAIEHGWGGRPDPRSDIAEFHLRAGRRDEAARIWAELKAEDPEDVWLFNGAGLSYSEVGEHELAILWLGDGIELAIRTGDPEGIVPQLSEVRRRNLAALGRDPDDLEGRADEFVARWRDPRRDSRWWSTVSGAADEWLGAPEAGGQSGNDDAVSVAMAWFPAGEYEKAIERWESLAEDWADVPHPEYCRWMDGHIKWMRAHGVHVRAVAPIVVDEFVGWCGDRDENPEKARAEYAADRYRLGEAIDWPPGRNEPCWCGSARKYREKRSHEHGCPECSPSAASVQLPIALASSEATTRSPTTTTLLLAQTEARAVCLSLATSPSFATFPFCSRGHRRLGRGRGYLWPRPAAAGWRCRQDRDFGWLCAVDESCWDAWPLRLFGGDEFWLGDLQGAESR